MITRHHISLACGGMLILYLPLIVGNPFLLPVVGAGVCIGAILPDIQMKRPRQFNALYPAWLLIQVFKKTVLRLYISLCARIFGIQPEYEDRRLTHSLPGLFFLTGFIASCVFLIMEVFPSSPELHYMRVFSAGIIVGLLFHFLADICTKKGLCLMYPFNETCRISGSIRPCNREDFRIRNFHIMTGVAIAAILLLYCTGLCPENLKWLVSIGTLVFCTGMMLHDAEVGISSAPRGEHHHTRGRDILSLTSGAEFGPAHAGHR
jgi:membrane-bound metal-dependent hydrolase YbcI (DUF457 family)